MQGNLHVRFGEGDEKLTQQWGKALDPYSIRAGPYGARLAAGNAPFAPANRQPDCVVASDPPC